MVHSEARTRFDDVTKNQPSNSWISWVHVEMLPYPLSRKKVMVELGIAISVSIRFDRLFDMRSVPHDLFAGFELKRVARPVESDLPISTGSVCPSVRLSVIYQYRKITPLQLMRSFREIM